MLTRSPGRSALTAIAVPLLVPAAVVAAGAPRREANPRRADQLAFANIEIKAQDLNGHVLEAAADRRLRPEISREVQNAARALDAAVRRELAGRHSAGMREIKLDLDVYGTLSTNVLDALRRGDHQEVGALDHAIDGSFDEQRTHMRAIERQRARAASRAE